LIFAFLLKVASGVVGFSKEAMKMVQYYRTKERFEPSPECEAVVNAKYQ